MSKQHREFAETHERNGSLHQRVARVWCRQCGVSTSLPISTGSSLMPPAFIAKKLIQKGWTIGDNSKWDFCPNHRPKNQPKERPALKIVAKEPEPTPQPAERKMEREDRRIIFEKLNEAYINEKTGYDAGWSDHRVATELGCPRKWVETVREEMFGSIGTSPEMAEFLSEAEALLAEGRKVLADAQKARDDALAVAEKIMDNLPNQRELLRISDRLGAVERLAEKVRKLVV